MVHGINGKDGSQPIFFTTQNKTGRLNDVKTEAIRQPISLKTTDTVDRKALDNLSPYAGLVQFTQKAPVGSVESYMKAAPEFGQWTGNFALSAEGVKDLEKTFTVANNICQNRAEVTKNIEEADLFNTLDQAFGIA